MRLMNDSSCGERRYGRGFDHRALRTGSIRNAVDVPLVQLAILSLGVLSLAAAAARGDERPSTAQPQGLREAVPSTWALVGGTVIPEPGREIQKATVVIRGGRLVAVGEGTAVPPDARVIDLENKYLYAGLIDAYTERSVSSDSVEEGLPYWNPAIRPQLRVIGQYQPDRQDNGVFRRQGITARLVAPAGGILKGSGAVVLTSDAPSERGVVARNVSQHMRLTTSRGRDTYPNSPMGAVALARQAMYDAQWYRQAWHAANADLTLPRPEQNDALAALNEAIESRRPFIADTSNELFLLRADRFAREFGLNLIVLGSGNEYRRLDAVRDTGRAVIIPVNFPKAPNVGTLEASLDVTLETLMHWDHAPENPARLAQAGVQFALCSHSLSDRSKFLAQVRKAIKRGLPEQTALAALTTVPAEMFDVDGDLGRIATGQMANLIVADGPLFGEKTKILETWVAGERFEHDPPPDRNVVGQWKITLASDDQPLELQLEIKEAKNKLSGTIQRGDTDAIKLTEVVLNGARLSVTFSGDDLDHRGIVRFTAVMEAGDKLGLGQLVWPDGTQDRLSMQRVDENKTSPSPKNVDGTGTEKKDEKTGKEPGPASFPVNYPLGAFGRSGPPEQPHRLAVTGVTIWTCGKAGILENATLLIGDGRILRVGTDVRIPKDATVIDGDGMHLTPGIIDCHSHMATDGGVNESGQAVTAEVRIGDFIDCDDVNIYRQLAGGVTSSNILHGSANPIGGQNQVIKLRWGALDDDMKFAEAPQGIKFALGENVKQSNWGDDHTTRYPQTRMGVEQIFIDEFRAAREYKERHRRWQVSHAGLPPRRNLELDAISEVLEGTRWIHCHSYRQDEILALIRVANRFGIRIGTFQHILEGYKVADEMARHGIMGSAFSDWWAYKFEVYDAIPYAGALMHNAGVVVSFNSDDRELARHLNHEAAKAVKYGGVDPEEALKFVTLNPAKQLRIDRYVGSIERGKHADFVLWSGSPLSTMSRCEQTWIDGRKYFDRAEDERLQKEQSRMRAALIQKILDSNADMAKPGEETVDEANLWPREDLFCHGHDHE